MIYNNTQGTTSKIFRVGKNGKTLVSDTNSLNIMETDGVTLSEINVKNLRINNFQVFDSSGKALSAISADNGVTPAEKTSWNDKQEKSTEVFVTLLASNWTGTSAPYTNNLSVLGVTTRSLNLISLSTTANLNETESFQSANIQDGGQSANTIILKALGDKPTINIPLRIIVGDNLK